MNDNKTFEYRCSATDYEAQTRFLTSVMEQICDNNLLLLEYKKQYTVPSELNGLKYEVVYTGRLEHANR